MNVGTDSLLPIWNAFYKHESGDARYLRHAPDGIIDCPTESQRILFGPKRRRVPKMIDLTNPVLLGPVRNQEHYMQGVVTRMSFREPILSATSKTLPDFGHIGRYYGLVTRNTDEG